MTLDPLDEVSRRVSRQCRFGKVRIFGNEMLWAGVQIGEVAPAAAGNEYFFADALSAFKNNDALATQAGLHRIHQTRGASAKNNCVIACDAAHTRDGIVQFHW